MEAIGIIPSQILVNTEMAEEAATPIADALEIKLIFAPEVEAFEAVGMFLNMGNAFG